MLVDYPAVEVHIQAKVERVHLVLLGKLMELEVLDFLLGGSGGGFRNFEHAAAGGGALEILASGKVIIDSGVKVSMNGGAVLVNPSIGANFSGGAGWKVPSVLYSPVLRILVSWKPKGEMLRGWIVENKEPNF